MKFNKLIFLENTKPVIDKKYFYSLIGYKSGKTRLKEKEKEMCEEIFSLGLEIIEPKGVYIIREIESKNDVITFKNTGIKLYGESMKKLLSDSFAVVFLAVTIGGGVDEEIVKFQKNGENHKAIIMDAFGSSAVEGVADSLNNILETEARQMGYTLTMRFSPGYGDLLLNFQKNLMKELEFYRIGIKLTPTNIMIPQKSITALIGVEK